MIFNPNMRESPRSTATVADAFMNDELENIRFTRDEQQLVSGFRLNSPRIKHLWFAKER